MARGVRFRCEKKSVDNAARRVGPRLFPLFLEVGVLTPTNFC